MKVDASASFRIARFMMALLLVAPLSGYSAHAVEPDEILQDQALENRARALSAKLRCVVCQNQSIDDSNAPLAKDLRVIVRERLVAGDSDAAVLDHVVARYGEFVLLQPRFALHTALLWGLPPALLVLSIGLLWWRRTRNEDITASGTNVAAPLNAREMERVQEIVTGRET